MLPVSDWTWAFWSMLVLAVSTSQIRTGIGRFEWTVALNPDVTSNQRLGRAVSDSAIAASLDVTVRRLIQEGGPQIATGPCRGAERVGNL